MSTVPQSPSADLLLIGKGHFLARRILAGGTFGPWHHLGNCTEIGSANEDTRLEKFESMTSEASLYKSGLQRRRNVYNATCDEFSVFNLSLLTMSEVITSSAQPDTPIVAEVLAADVAASTLGGALGNQIFFLAKMGPVESLVLDVGETELTLGTDYEVLFNRKGSVAIRILPGSAVTTDGEDDLTADYTPTAYSSGMSVLRLGTESTIECQLRFVGDPTEGPAKQLDVWRANVSPQGGLTLVSEEYASYQLQFEVLSDAINHPNSPLGELTMIDG